jgi:hypothetical protein
MKQRVIEQFLLLDRWRTLIDLAIVMNVSAEEAIKREISNRITSKPGSIMNIPVLTTLSNSVVETISRYGGRFPAIVEYDTSGGGNVRNSNARLAGRILDHLENFLNPLILVVPKREVARLPLKDGGCFTADARNQLVDCIAKFGTRMKRSDAEGDPDYVQMIGCGIFGARRSSFLV